ncbi:MAG TPA: InlB B-repeat-containing protein, partial [Methanocorpusculum sp.]|nr:InlB B-repeat-containing protein [Methanocorpusculum sp.]
MKLSIVSNGRPPSSRALHKAVRAVLLSFLIILVCAAAFCGCVSAADVTVSNWDELNTSLSDGTDGTIQLSEPISINYCNVTPPTMGQGSIGVIDIKSGKKTLDLNGSYINISNASKNDYLVLFNITDGASLTVTDSKVNGNKGNISANVSIMVAVWGGGSFTLTNGTSLITYGSPNCWVTGASPFSTVIAIEGQDENCKNISKIKIDKDSKIEDNTTYEKDFTITIYQKGGPLDTSSPTSNNGGGVDLNIDGIISGPRGIWVIGNIKNINYAPNITIGSDAKIVTTNSSSDNTIALSAMGYANWIITGGTFEAADALIIKAGKSEISGGNFKGTGNWKEPSATVSNAEPTGAAISVIGNSSYARNVSLTITGGKFISDNGHAFLESSLKDKSALGEGITITGGEFITDNKTLYPIKITNIKGKSVSVTLGDKTPCYPGLNTSSFTWVNDTNGKWTVTFNQKIQNLENINLSLVKTGSTVKLVGALGKIVNEYSKPFVEWRSSDDKIYLTNAEEIPVGFVYTPSFEQTTTFNVKFNPNGGTGEMTVQTFISGKEQALNPNKFEKGNSEFAGWAEKEKGPVVYANKQVITIDKNKDLYAVWNAIKAPETNVQKVKKNETSPAIDLNVSSDKVTITNTTELKQVE